MRTLILLAVCLIFGLVGALEAKRSKRDPRAILIQGLVGAAVGGFVWYYFIKNLITVGFFGR